MLTEKVTGGTEETEALNASENGWLNSLESGV